MCMTLEQQKNDKTIVRTKSIKCSRFIKIPPLYFLKVVSWDSFVQYRNLLWPFLIKNIIVIVLQKSSSWTLRPRCLWSSCGPYRVLWEESKFLVLMRQNMYRLITLLIMWPFLRHICDSANDFIEKLKVF